MRLRYLLPLLAPLCLGLSACGIFGGAKPAHKPAKLTQIKHPQIKAKVLWRRGIGEGTRLFSDLRPMVHGKRVYAADANGNVWAFNAKNGDTVWKHDTHLKLLSGPSLADGMIMVGSLNGHVVALNPKNGKEIWRGQASSEVLSAPVGSGGTIVVRSVDGIVYGLSASDGTRLWSYSSNEPRLTLRGTSRPVIADGDAIIGLDNGKVVALSMDTGKVDWKTVLAVPSGASELEQLVDVDGHLAHDFADLYAASYGDQLAAIDLQSGHILWRDKIASYTGVTLGRNTLFVADPSSTLYSLDSFTGARNWKNNVLSYRGLTRPVLQGNYVVVADQEGYLHWFTRAGGQLAGRFQVEDVGFTSAPVVSGNTLYIEADNGRLTAVRINPVKQSSGKASKASSKSGSTSGKSAASSASGQAPAPAPSSGGSSPLAKPRLPSPQSGNGGVFGGSTQPEQ